MQAEDAEAPEDRDRQPPGALVQGLLAALVVFGLNFASLLVARQGGAVAAIWPGDGALLGLLLLSPNPRPAVIVAFGYAGGVLAELAWGDGPLLAMALPAANSLGLALAYAVIRRGLRAPDLRQANHLVFFLGVSTASAALSGLFGAGALTLLTGAPFTANFITWAAADGLGYIIVTPLLVILGARRPPAAIDPRQWAHAAITLGAYAVLATAVFVQTQYPFLFFIPLGLFTVAYHLELKGAAAAVLLTTLIAIGLGVAGRGPVALIQAGSTERLIVLQIFLASMAVSILPIAAAITERTRLAQSLAAANREARAAARRAEEANRLAMMAEDIAQVGHWRWDLVTGETVWSRQLLAICGYDPGAPPPALAAPLLEAVAREDRERLSRRVEQAAVDGLPFAQEVRLMRADGERHLLVHGAGEYDPAGGVSALYGMALDVTRAKQAERALQEARQVAEEAAAAKSDFLANVSHELRTPLASVLGFSNLLSDHRGLDENARRYADNIGAAARSLLTAINDILSFSKLEAGQVEIRPQVMSPPALVAEIMPLFQLQAEAKALTLSCDVDPRTPQWVVGDESRLRQVLLNLVGNAVKFTASGSVQLRLGYAAGDRLRFEVIDTGPGIDPDRRDRLFERFFQVDDWRQRAHAGTGLGLAISKGLVEAMGGAIGVESAPGMGSCFWFEAPAQAASAPDEAPAAAAPVAGRVLVVDDVKVNREIVQLALAPLNLAVAEAEDGMAAMALARENAFDVILMDLGMPRVDGFQAARAIRQPAYASRSALIVGVSAVDPSPSLWAELKAAGFDGFVAKPFTSDDLVKLVRRRLSQDQAG